VHGCAYHNLINCDSSVGVVTRLLAGRPSICLSFPSMDNNSPLFFVVFRKRCGTPSLAI